MRRLPVIVADAPVWAISAGRLDPAAGRYGRWEAMASTTSATADSSLDEDGIPFKAFWGIPIHPAVLGAGR